MGNVLLPLWAECPMLTRLVVVGYPVMSLGFQMISSAGLEWLVTDLFDNSLHSLKSFRLWTLLWGPFYQPLSSGMAFLMIMFEMYMSMAYFPWREKEMGSFLFLLWMFLINAATTLAYLSIMFCFATYYHGTWNEMRYMYQPMKGLWPLVMVSLTLNSLSDPDGSTSFWGLMMIPNKWYPIALVAFFSLLNGMKIQWSIACAVAIGYAYPKLRLERCLPSRTKADRLEQRCCAHGRCGFLERLTKASWVPASSTSGSGASADTGGGWGFWGGSSEESPAPSSSGGRGGNFTAFAGSGNRLGEASVPLAPATASDELATRGTEMQPPGPLPDGV
eukprot:TRINITY_DN108566_c0_g1_i1.p1 TRINITY_DN108566_c0_g1~~TRINITY_DN108566_c0_g1_i1.p1  ORF type:complete len:354 (+),score=31.19 TRINITY_DN108566_c0_g1_i1:64-1062(+)